MVRITIARYHSGDVHRFSGLRPWHGIVVAVAILVIFALFSMLLGPHGFVHAAVPARETQ
jgi:hypothetical protein